MEDSTLLTIALLTALMGLGLLWFSTTKFQPQEVPLESITDEYLGRVVTVPGVVENVIEFDKAVVVSLKNSELKLFGFKTDIPKLEEGAKILITGEIKEYKGTLEIVPRKKGDVVVGT